MSMKQVVFALALTIAAPISAWAAHSGQFSNTDGKVGVWGRDGSWNAAIDTDSGDGHCHFKREVEEDSDNQLTYSYGNCNIIITQSTADSTKVSATSACSQYFCHGSATLDLDNATRD